MRASEVRTFPALPDIVTGYELNPQRGWFAVIVPAGRTNLVTNPSLELNSTGYSAAGSASIARDASQQRRGVYSLKVSPTAGGLTDGAYYTVSGLAAATPYAFSCDFLGTAAGVGYLATLQDTVGNIRGRYSFRATGRWQRVSVVAATAGAGTYRLSVTKDSNRSAAPFYLDGFQLEQGNYATTYIDGDLKGFVSTRPDFYWNGTPHGSTSTRSAQCRAGGVLVNLKNLGFRLTAVIGLGLSGLINYMVPLAQGGAYYQGTNIGDREFSLVGALTATNVQDLMRQRQALVDVFKPDIVAPDQPIVLRYQPSDCDAPVGDELEIVCVFKDGLAGQLDNRFQERVALGFQLYLPFVAREDGEVGAALGYQTSAANANLMLYRSAAGVWSGININSVTNVNTAARLSDGTYAVGGDFLNAGGIGEADYLFRFNPVTGTLSAFNLTPLNGAVYDIVPLPDGNALLLGAFTNAGGDANADYACYLNVSTGAFSAINATPLGNSALCGAVLSDGTYAIGGNFLNAGGDGNADYLARITPSTGAYSSFNATPLNGAVKVMSNEASGHLIVGGSFTNAGGDSNADYIARLNISTLVFVSLSSQLLDNDVATLLQGKNNVMYVGGRFTTPFNYLMQYNGKAFSAVGGGVNSSVYGSALLRDGSIVFSGAFTSAGGLPLFDRLALFNGSTLVPVPIDVPGAPIIYSVETSGSDLLVGFSTAGTAVSEALTTVANAGSEKSYPKVTLTGPGTVYQIKNYTIGKTIYFNLTLAAGETAVLDFTDPLNITFTSNWRGNITSVILKGSDLDFFLAPGDNALSLYIGGSVTAATAAQITWRNTFHSLDGAIPQRLLQ